MGKKLGAEKVHPHKFRRTMATRAIEKGMPIEQVQKILGFVVRARNPAGGISFVSFL